VVVVVVMMVVVVRMMWPQTHDQPVMVVVMMMVVMTDLHRDLGDLVGRPFSAPGFLSFQQRYRVRNRIKKIPIARCRSEFWRCRRGRLGGRHRCESSGCSQ
jgi:hypothetical protein